MIKLLLKSSAALLGLVVFAAVADPAPEPPIAAAQGAAPARSAPAVTLLTLETSDVVLEEVDASKDSIKVELPAEFLASQIDVVEVITTALGRPLPHGSTTVVPVDVGKQGERLEATFDLHEFKATGTYAVKVRLFGTPRGGTAGQQIVQLKVTKPAAEIRMAKPIRLERTVYLPCCWSDLQPDKITLTESTGRSFVSLDSEWTVPLQSGTKPLESAQVIFDLPEAVNGKGQGTVTFKVAGDVPLGTSSGTLTMHAPQFATGSADIPVELTSRVSALWLFVTVVVGILLGHFFRNRLEPQKARLEALRAAEAEVATIERLLSETGDQRFKGRLEKIKKELVAAIDKSDVSPEELNSAVHKAATERTKEHTQYETDRDKATELLEKWRSAMRLRGAVPAQLLSELKELSSELEILVDALGRGEVGDTQRALDEHIPGRVARVNRAISNWQGEIADDLKKFTKPWPESPLSRLFADLVIHNDKLGAELTKAEPGPDHLKAVLQQVTELAVRIASDLLGRVGKVIVQNADSIVALLDATPPEDKRNEIRARQDRVVQLIESPKDVRPASFFDAIDGLWEAINAAVEAAWPTRDDTIQNKLNGGQFGEAIKALRAPRETRLGGFAHQEQIPMADALPEAASGQRTWNEVLVAQTPQKPDWHLCLVSERDVIVGKPTQVRAEIVGRSSTQGLLVKTWSAQDADTIGASSGFVQWFRFKAEGEKVVSVQIVDEHGVPSEKQITLMVRRDHGEAAALRAQRSLKEIRCVQNLITGFIIAAGGYAIFAGAFVGTLADFFAAFLWGFAADVGAAKVRDMSDSIAGLKMAAPRQQQ